MTEDKFLNKKFKLKKDVDIIFEINAKYPSGQAGVLIDEYGINFNNNKIRLSADFIGLLFEEYKPEIKEEISPREEAEAKIGAHQPEPVMPKMKVSFKKGKRKTKG